MRRFSVVVVVAVLAACGGGERRGSSLGPSAPAGAADPAAMRALLARYSASGHGIVAAVESLPPKVVMGNGWEVTINPGARFDDFLQDGAPENTVRFITTGVHEVTHTYITWMAFKLLADRGGVYGAGALAIPADGEPTVVPLTALFPTAEIDATFPADARTFRYGEYVTPTDMRLGTQTWGIYGLLDELAAYYQDSKTTLDLWPWVRDEAPAEGRVVLNYLVLLDDLRMPLAELQVYMLHYLVYAKQQRPEIYDAVVGNAEFREAFNAVVDGYTALVARAAELEPTVYAFARARGLDIERRGGRIILDGRPLSSADRAPYDAIVGYVEAEPYASMRAALR